VRGSPIMRELRQLTMLPLRRETIFHLVFDPNGMTTSSINQLIAADPGLALAALRLAPRALREGRVTVAQVSRFAAPAAIFEIIRSHPAAATTGSGSHESLIDQLWIHSIAVAHAARNLSRKHHYEHPQTAFLAGLLHNLGLLAAASIAPAVVAELLAQCNSSAELLDAEHDRLGAAHTSIANQFAKRWGLPQWLHEVMWWHHQPDATVPRSVTDRALVNLVREADELVSGSDFALGRTADGKAWSLPWKNADAIAAVVTRGVRQSWNRLQEHPLCDSPEEHNKLVTRAADLAGRNVALHANFDWQKQAWDKLAALPVDATPAELTGVVSEAFAQSLGALGSLCYVRNEDGSAAEGTFWCDNARPVSCSLETGAGTKPHAAQIVAKLRPAWQQRPYQVVGLNAGEINLAHVLLWLDEYGPLPSEPTLQQVTQLCTRWLSHAVHVAELESQLEGFTAALRDQAALADAQLENSKLAALAELAAGAGHEINNPLAVISGRAQLLLAEETEPRRRKSLETIMAQAQRIHCMIVDLMLFARPPAPDSKPTSVRDVVDRAIGKLKADADAAQLTLGIVAAAELPLISCDAGQLALALECILRNAMDASSVGSTIGVTAEAAPHGKLHIRVSDRGGGISDEQRRHIFEPFYSGREAGRGLGMGLSKAWRIIQNHGGEIQVESGPNGTTVTVALAALAAAAGERVCA